MVVWLAAHRAKITQETTVADGFDKPGAGAA
jgi:hypothetical protein